MIQFLEIVFSTIISTVLVLLGIFQFWWKKKIIHSTADKIQIINKQRDVFSKFLDLWSERVIGKAHKPNSDWLERFARASKEVVLWCPDSVLEQIALFVETFDPHKPKESEIHFAKAILSFRKTLGYKNWRKKITPEQIIKIFDTGTKKHK